MAFTATNGDEVDLAKMKGKVVLVDFWRLGAVPASQHCPISKKSTRSIRTKDLKSSVFHSMKTKIPYPDSQKWSEMPWPQYFDGLGFDGNT